MRSSFKYFPILGLATVTGLAAGFVGCDSGGPASTPPPFTTGTGGGSAGSGGSGSGGSASGGSTGTGGNQGTGGGPDTGTGGGSGGATPVDGGGGTPNPDGGMGGSGGAVMPGAEITKVVPTSGCGKAPGPTGRQTIPTMGTKPAGCADSKCGPWAYTREYFVFLPAGYVNTKAYPLVFQGPGCGGNGQGIYPLGGIAGEVIRVGLTPPPNDIGHATNPGQGCFDDKEGDDSVDWVFYENLHDKLAAAYCFDKNRVFSSGNSSASWFSNEVGCKYAGDPMRPIRGVMPNTGGLPTNPAWVPTCTKAPMAGMWIHEVGDSTNPFSGNKVAINRAMPLNGCPAGQNYDNTMFDNFPIGGGNADTTCRKIRCSGPLYPLVVCPLPGNGHGSHDNVANPGFSAFVKLFSAGALISM